MINLTKVIGSFVKNSGLTQKSGDPSYMCRVAAPNRDGGSIFIEAFLPENFSTSVSSDYDTPFAQGFGLGKAESIQLGAKLMGLSTTTQLMSMQVWQGSAPMDFNIQMVFLLDSNAENDVLKPLRDLMSLVLPSTIGANVSSLGVNNGSGSGTLKGFGGILVSPGPKMRISDTSLDTLLGRFVSGALGGVGSLTKIDSTKSVKENMNAVSDSLMANNILGGVEVYDNISLDIGGFMYFPSVVIKDVSIDNEIRLDKVAKKPISVTTTVSFTTFVTPKAEDLTTIIPRG